MNNCNQPYHANEEIEHVRELVSFCDLNPEQWDEIKYYSDLLKTGSANPKESDAVRAMVAESWIRSKGYGLSSERPESIKCLSLSQFHKVLKDDHLLTETAAPLFKESLSVLTPDSNFGLLLMNRHGIVLNSCNGSYWPYCDLLSKPGTDLSEESVGTTSHSLCMQSENPIYLISPENYHEVLRIAQVAISMPIRDIHDKVTATMVLSTHNDFRQFKYEKHLFRCLIAFQFSLTKRIEEGLRLANRHYQMGFEAKDNVAEHNSTTLPSTLSIEHIFGKSAEMVRSKRIVRKVSRSRNNILLIGESGTGKELFARAIHNESRPDGLFVAINCSSIPKGLIESELFGYEGGSFTGAERKGRLGKFELADGGTLFLDEIGDMPLELQPVLLRILEDQQVTRVGGNKTIPVNVRVIAATNQNLAESIKNKEFREDLYFRLAVFKIYIPPLRLRESDILDLARQFIDNECRELSIPLLEMDPYASRIIRHYHWPGNVRQLKNAMYYAVNMAEDGMIKISDLPDEITGDMYFSNPNSVPRSIIKLEREEIEKAMLYTQNNVRRAAELLEMSRSTLYRKLKDYEIYFEEDL